MEGRKGLTGEDTGSCHACSAPGEMRGREGKRGEQRKGEEKEMGGISINTTHYPSPKKAKFLLLTRPTPKDSK